MARWGAVLALLLGVLAGHPINAANPPATAPNVDLNAYMGRWYEIVRLPNSFEEKCKSNVTAEYTLLDDGDIRVQNSCLLHDGTYNVAEGLAWRGSEGDNAKLRVSFVPFFKNFHLFSGDYWIFDVDESEYALIGSPDHDLLWVLARQPVLEAGLLDRLLDKARELGFDTGPLIYTHQNWNE